MIVDTYNNAWLNVPSSYINHSACSTVETCRQDLYSRIEGVYREGVKKG